MKFGLGCYHRYLNPLALRSLIPCKGVWGTFPLLFCLFDVHHHHDHPWLTEWNTIRLLGCVLTHFRFLQILFWLLQLPCSLCLHGLDAFSRETQLLKCFQKFLYQYSSSTCCLDWKFPCQKKSTEGMLCVLYKWGKKNPYSLGRKGEEL